MPLISRTYRITKEQDAKVKKNKKKYGSESAAVRAGIETL